MLVASDVATSDRRLATLTEALSLGPLPIDEHVAANWTRLRVNLRDNGQRMPINDSWIAATALALDVLVVTQDDDYPELDDLAVVRV